MLKETTRFLKSYIQKLKNRVPKDSGKLAKSIKGNVVETSDKVTLDLEAVDYFEFIDKGVSGTQRKFNTPFSYKTKSPPASAFKSVTNSLSGQFAIARSIKERGIRPKNFFSKPLDNDMDGLAESVMDDYWEKF